jgi:hypothetical protein
MAFKTGISRRGLFQASAGAAAGVGLGLDPDLLLAQASAGAPAVPASLSAAEAAVDRHGDAILRISREVWELAELSIVEVHSFRIHLRELETAGFTTVSTGTSGYPTAFVSEWTQGSGGPVVAYLPEYDALPGLGNAAEPRQTPGASGVTDGHGCGHNMLGAGCMGAALALGLAGRSLLLLLLALFAVVILAKALSAPLSAAVASAGLPPAVTGAIVAAVVLLPEGIAAVRSARLNRLQNSINLALGSGIASIGLTLAAVAVVSLAFGLPIDLGVSPEQITLLALTLFVATLTLGTGRTTVLNDAIHLTLAAAFLTITVVP